MTFVTVPIEWFLIVLQYTIKFRSLIKGIKVYSIMKEDALKRIATGEPPFEGTWVFKLQSFMWRIRHRFLTEYTAKEVVDSYYSLLQSLTIRSEDQETTRFNFKNSEIRVAAGTIVIDEIWAINGNGKGVYAHKRKTPQHDWELVYRTGSILKEFDFIKKLDTAARAECLFVPMIENHSSHIAENTTIN